MFLQVKSVHTHFFFFISLPGFNFRNGRKSESRDAKRTVEKGRRKKRKKTQEKDLGLSLRRCLFNVFVIDFLKITKIQ